MLRGWRGVGLGGVGGREAFPLCDSLCQSQVGVNVQSAASFCLPVKTWSKKRATVDRKLNCGWSLGSFRAPPLGALLLRGGREGGRGRGEGPRAQQVCWEGRWEQQCSRCVHVPLHCPSRAAPSVRVTVCVHRHANQRFVFQFQWDDLCLRSADFWSPVVNMAACWSLHCGIHVLCCV